MEEYETVTKQGKIEKRIFVDSGKYAIYGYELDGKMTSKYRIIFKGNERKSLFIIGTGKGKNLAVESEYEDEVYVLKNGKSLRVSELLV